MVNKVYIVWCQMNKNTARFDLGVFTTKLTAEQTKNDYSGLNAHKLWVEEYKLCTH